MDATEHDGVEDPVGDKLKEKIYFYEEETDQVQRSRVNVIKPVQGISKQEMYDAML